MGFWKFTSMWTLNNTLLNKQCVKREFRENILRLVKMKTTHIKTYDAA